MPGGRPTLYKPENAEIVRLACMLGATNETLAERFEVSRRTVDNWIATIPEFSDAVRRGHQVAYETVISALFARATGMEQKMTKVFCHRGQPVTASYIVQLPPDVRACIFWLRNPRPEQWRENRPLADGKDDEEWVSELEAASERARLASLPAASQALRSSPPPSCSSPPSGQGYRMWHASRCFSHSWNREHPQGEILESIQACPDKI